MIFGRGHLKLYIKSTLSSHKNGGQTYFCSKTYGHGLIGFNSRNLRKPNCIVTVQNIQHGILIQIQYGNDKDFFTLFTKMLLSIQSHSSECHTLVMNGALGKELVASQRTQDRNKIQPDSDKGIGTGLVTATQSLQKYREVHSEAHVDVNAINLIVNFIALQTANLSDGH